MSRYMMVTVTKRNTEESFTGCTRDDGLQSLWAVYPDNGDGVKYASVLDTLVWGKEVSEQVYVDYMHSRMALPDGTITPSLEEKMYVVCRQCGEAFDDIAVAYKEHTPGECGSEQGWDILPESEAM